MAYKFQEGAAKLDGAISGSSTIVAKSSISSSADLAVTGNIHFAGEIYGDGSNLTDVTAAPAGSDTQLQYNNGGSLGAASTVTFNDSTLVLSLTRTGSFASVTCTGSISGSSTLVVGGTINGSGNWASSGSITAGSSFIIGSADLNETDMEKLDGITNGTAAAAKAVVLDASKNIATIGTVGCGAITSTGASTMGSLDVGGTLACDTSFTIDAVVLNATELGYVDGVTAGAGAASKALVLDASADVASGLRSVTGSGDLKFANVHATTSIFAGGEMSASKDVYAGDGGNVGFLSRAGMLLGWDGSSDGNLDMGASGYISGASGIEMVGNAVFVGQHAVSGGVQYDVNTVTSHTELTASSSKMYQLVSGGTAAIQVLLPSASAGENYQYVIKRHALMSGNVVITSSGGDAADVDKSIDGEDKITLETAGASVFLISDGAMWNIF
jgi:hypothetical protein